jgi:hypothetical protein
MACTAVARPKAKAATAINLIIVFSDLILSKKDFLEGLILSSFNSTILDAGQKLDGRTHKKRRPTTCGWTPERGLVSRREGKPVRADHILRLDGGPPAMKTMWLQSK